MTSIDKLLIQGIRSFSPDDPSIITFEKPLTVICGHNGAGKTTIIECLKHACTGEMPPNSSRGHTFVHDPRATGRTEVKARTKLAFHTAGGKPIICCRSFQLAQKQSKPEFKVLDSALVTYGANHQKVSQSMKCADLDREIPELMGAGKAILEYVVFCHQEDSNWPLSDGATLKKRFDEIFAATRYTKALEVLKKHRQEQTTAAKEFRNEMAQLQIYKKQAEDTRREVELHKSQVREFETASGSLQERIATAERELKRLSGILQQIDGLHSELHALEVRKQERLKNRDKLYEMMEVEYDDPDDQLVQAEQRMQRDMDDIERRVKQTEASLGEIRGSKSKLERTIHDQTLKIGEFRANAMAHEKNIQERASLCKTVAERHGEMFTAVSSDGTDAFVQNMRARLTAAHDELLSTKMQLRKAEEEVQVKITQRKSEEAAKQEQRRQKQRQLQAHQATRDQLQAEIAGRGVTEDQLTRALSEEKFLESELRALHEGAEHSGLIQQTEALDRTRADLKHKLTQLAEEIQSLSSHAQEQAQMSVLKKEANEKESEIQHIMNSRRDAFISTIGFLPSSDHLDEELAKALRDKKSLQLETATKLQDRQKQLGSIEGKLRDAEDLLSRHEQQISALMQRLTESGKSDKPFQALLADAEKQVEKSKHDLTLVNSLKITYNKFIEQTRSEHHCPLCQRGFDTDQQLAELVENLYEKIGKVPELLQKRQKDVDDAEQNLKSMRQLQPTWDELQRLRDQEIPQLKKKLAQYQQEHQTLTAAVGELTTIHDKSNSECTAIQALREDSQTVQRLTQHVRQLRKDVERMEAMLSMRSGQRSLADATAESTALERQRNDVERQLDELRNKKATLDKSLMDTERALNAARTRRENIQAQMRERKAKEVQISAEAEQCRQLEREIGEMTAWFEQIQHHLKQLQHEKEQVVRQAREKEHGMQERCNMIERDVERLNSLTRAIEQYVTENKDVTLSTSEQQLQDLQQQMVSLSTRETNLSEQLEQLKNTQADKSAAERRLRDNLEYRAELRAIEQVERDIATKKNEIQTLAAGDGVRREHGAMQAQVAKLQQEAAAVGGRSRVHQDLITNLEHKLRTEPNFKNIEEKCRRKLIEVTTTEMANHDLDQYYTALEKALMRYHSLKMSEINKTIRELWQSTYRGQDIDTIEIRSDPDAASARSFNYRVVMIKGDNELDMRGRCSAGQKVLASLVIRLALAETFCVNCGILALDEPTTNLDHDNIESFAQALTRIIEARRQQTNFQLIVITHDEDFVRMLGRSQFSDRFWRVLKDANHYSRIKAEDIRSLG